MLSFQTREVAIDHLARVIRLLKQLRPVLTFETLLQGLVVSVCPCLVAAGWLNEEDSVRLKGKTIGYELASPWCGNTLS